MNLKLGWEIRRRRAQASFFHRSTASSLCARAEIELYSRGGPFLHTHAAASVPCLASSALPLCHVVGRRLSRAAAHLDGPPRRRPGDLTASTWASSQRCLALMLALGFAILVLLALYLCVIVSFAPPNRGRATRSASSCSRRQPPRRRLLARGWRERSGALGSPIFWRRCRRWRQPPRRRRRRRRRCAARRGAQLDGAAGGGVRRLPAAAAAGRRQRDAAECGTRACATRSARRRRPPPRRRRSRADGAGGGGGRADRRRRRIDDESLWRGRWARWRSPCFRWRRRSRWARSAAGARSSSSPSSSR